MKRILTAVIASALSLFTFAGCSFSHPKPPVDSTPTDPSLEAVYSQLSEAKTAFDISQLMTAASDSVIYTETDDTQPFMLYFDVLLSSFRSFIITEHNGDKYLIFRYNYSAYGSVLTELNSFEKKMNGDTLELKADITTEQTEQMGCEPLESNVNCILRLDNDISGLIIDGHDYTPYSGGTLYIGDKVGVLDKDLNITVPVEYDMIRKITGLPDNKVLYHTYKDGCGGGILDENYNTLLPPEFGNIFYINDNKFIVMKQDSSVDTNYYILSTDRHGNPTSSFTEGFIDGSETFFNYAEQVIFGVRDGNRFKYGVIDSDLNIIIEPVYDHISTFEKTAPTQFYVVEDSHENFAVFDSFGTQKTKFEASSVYDVQTAYNESLRGQSYK